MISQHRNHTQSRKRRPPQFELVAGNAGLDFINTLDDRFTEPKELLTSYADLIRFGEDSGILTPRRCGHSSQAKRRRTGNCRTPDATIFEHLGSGVKIYHGVDLTYGYNLFIGDGASDPPARSPQRSRRHHHRKNAIIGSYSRIYSFCTTPRDYEIRLQPTVIGDGAHIASHAIVLAGKNVASGAAIGSFPADQA